MRVKVIILMVLIVLFTIFITQNTDTVKIGVFFWQFEMSAIVLIILIGLLGVIVGFTLAKIFNTANEKVDKEVNNLTETKI